MLIWIRRGAGTGAGALLAICQRLCEREGDGEGKGGRWQGACGSANRRQEGRGRQRFHLNLPSIALSCEF